MSFMKNVQCFLSDITFNYSSVAAFATNEALKSTGILTSCITHRQTRKLHRKIPWSRGRNLQ